MKSAQILRKTLLFALAFFSLTTIFYKFTSIHALTIFILSFIISLKDFANLRPKQSIILGFAVIVLLTAATLIGQNALWLPIIVGVTGLLSIYANRTAGGVFGIAPAYVATTGFLMTDADYLIVPVFALLGFTYAFLVQHLTKIAFKHHAMNKDIALSYGVFLAIAGAAATWISLQLPAPHPYWFVLAVIMVLHPQHSKTFGVMWKRSAATVVGALIAIVILKFFSTPFVIVIAIITATLFFRYLLLSKYFAQITFITIPLLLVLSLNANNTEGGLALARVYLTLSGTAFAAILYSVGLLIMRTVYKNGVEAEAI